ncbi:MAG: hypothetical protein R2711_11135 [Acidimicrobiales bacterium]
MFGITCGLLLASEVGDDEHAASLALAGVLLLATSLGAWLLWIPWASAVVEPDPGLITLFMDAFLATLFISALQAVIFGFAPLDALYGKTLQRWNWRVWLALYVAALLPGAAAAAPQRQSLGRGQQHLVLADVRPVRCVPGGAIVFWGWYQLRSGGASIRRRPSRPARPSTPRRARLGARVPARFRCTGA